MRAVETIEYGTMGTEAPHVLAGSVLDVCAFVDDLPSDAAGELAFSEPEGEQGAVFVEGGRVCWAAARGLARRLSDLLAVNANLSREAMEALYCACRLQRAPLGEFLVNAGVVTAAQLRAALLVHTGESLRALCVPGAYARWSPRHTGRYCSRFTFSTTDLVVRACPEAYGELGPMATYELADAFTGEGEWGLAFVRCPGAAVPVPIASYGALPPRAEALLRLGRWAASILDLTGEAHDEGALAAAVMGPGALVAWRWGAAIVAGWTRSHGPARLLNRRARSRRETIGRGRV